MPFPVDERFIVQAEQLSAAGLPDAYREKLLAENGGDLETARDHWLLHPVRDQSDEKRPKRTCNDIVLETRRAREWSGFPQSAVVVGDKGGGDQLVFLPAEGDPAALGPVLYRRSTRLANCTRGDIADLSDACAAFR